MIRTTAALLGVTTLLIITPVAPAPPANAAVNIDVNIGFGIGTNLNRGRRLSCRQGERILRNRGFRDIRRINCSGRYFTYRGWRRDRRYEVSLRSRDGRVADVRRLRR